MNPPKIACVIRIDDGDVWYEEKKTCRKRKLNKTIKESKSIKRDKNILRLKRPLMERIKPICDRMKCYENCVRKRLLKNSKAAKNRKQKESNKIKNKKHVTKIKKSEPNQKTSVNGKTKSSSNKKRCTRKRKHKKKRPANSDQNVTYQTTGSTGSIYIEGLSPISCEDNLELSYESISSDSFAEDEVDLRLKAKQRTKKLSKHAKFSPEPIPEVSPKETSTHNRYSSPTFEPFADALRSSTPSCTEDNATVFSSEMDVSIHSLATVVMSPRVDSSLYSPTNSPTQLMSFNKLYEDISDDEGKPAVKCEPYDYKSNDWFAISSDLDTKVKAEMKLEKEFDFNAGHKAIKNEPNNNDSKVYCSKSCYYNNKDCSKSVICYVKVENNF